jgi:hypothetical protein
MDPISIDGDEYDASSDDMEFNKASPLAPIVDDKHLGPSGQKLRTPSDSRVTSDVASDASSDADKGNCVQTFPQSAISRWLSKLLEGCFQQRNSSILPPVPADSNNAKLPSLVDCPWVQEVCKGKETTFADEDLGCYIHLWGQDDQRWEYEDCKGLGRGARDIKMEGLRAQCPRGELE